MRRLLYIMLYISTLLFAQQSKEDRLLVNITQNIPYVYANDHGTQVKIERIQDTEHRLSDDFTKTSRVCPPFCIQPIRPVRGVKNIEEVGLLDFIAHKIPAKKALLVDTRLKNWYELETIPGAINIPFTIVKNGNPKIIEKLFTLFGAKKKDDGSFDFTNAKELAVFCNGVWCGQSPEFIRGIVEDGYPANKIYYYRSGFQGWKLLGLTTLIHKAEVAKEAK